MNDLTIWALFDDAERSYFNALKDKNVNVISVGINDIDCPNYRKIDLSITNPKLIKELSKLPKPDIILASPPCESWSIADNQRRAIDKLISQANNNNTFFMELRNKDFYYYNNLNSITFLQRDFFKQHSTRLNGEMTTLATMKIIEHFQPKYWIIENPQSSKIWEYMNHMSGKIREGHYNLAYYNNYDPLFTTKPTYFNSNIKLELNHNKIKQDKKWSETTGYGRRSSIPKYLILHIYELILKDMEGGDINE